MNWPVLLILLYLVMGIQQGLGDVLKLSVPRLGVVEPMLPLIILGLISLYAQRGHLLVGAAIIGLLLDLTHMYPFAHLEGHVTLIGPWTIGCMAGAVLVNNMRESLRPEHPLSLAFASLFVSVVTHVLHMILLYVRHGFAIVVSRINASESLYPAIKGLDLASFIAIAGNIGCTVILAVILAWPLFKLLPLLGFEDQVKKRRFS